MTLMNNVNAQVHVGINSKLQQHSPEWVASLRKTVRARLLEMKHVFSESDFTEAIKLMGVQQLTLSGVTFLLYTF